MKRLPYPGYARGNEIWPPLAVALVVLFLSLITGIAATQVPPLVLLILAAGPLVFLALIKYLEVGILYYVVLFGLLTTNSLGLISDYLLIPPGLRNFLIVILMVVAGVCFAVIKRPPRLFALGSVHATAFLFGMVLLLGLMWSPSTVGGPMKLQGYFLVNFLPMLLVALFAGELIRLKRTVYAAAFMGILFFIWGVSAVLIHPPDTWGRDILGIGNPIWVARILGVFALSLIIVAQITSQRIPKVTFWVVAAGLVVLMLYTGSRGPVVSIIFVLLVYFLLLSKRPVWQSLVITVLGVVGLYFALSALDSNIQDRFRYSGELTSGGDFSVSLRLQEWREARELFYSYPIAGVGTNGFNLSTDGLDVYPHNLVLETASELGLLGLAALFAFLLSSIRLAYQVFPKKPRIDRENFVAIWGIGIFLYALANSMFSGDVIGNSLIWFSSGFMLATYATINRSDSLEAPSRY